MRTLVSIGLFVLVLTAILASGCSGTTSLPQSTPPVTPTSTPLAAAPASAEELVAFVERAYEYAQVHGQDAALAEFNDPDGRFVEGELYIFAYDLKGTTLALPFQPDLLGKNRWNTTDPNGTPFIQDLIRTAQSDGGFVRYQYLDPSDNFTVKQKLSYVMLVDRNWVIGSGIYAPEEDTPIVSVGNDPRVREALQSIVVEAIAYAGEHGKTAALAEFNDRNGTFVRGNLYIYAFDYNGTTLALPHQPQRIGTDLSGLQDPFGVNYTMVEIFLAEQGGGFIYYHYPNPARNMTLEPKMSYVAPVDDTWWLGAGVYIEDANQTFRPEGSVGGSETVRNLTLYTEQLPPFNYEENGTLQGISIDLLEAITAKMGEPVSREDVHLVPWADAYQAGLTQDGTVIFMTGRVPQREALFKWAGPIYTNHNVLFARPDSGITIANPADLQGYRIGVIADDITVQQLLDLGVNASQLVPGTNVSNLIDRLEAGEIDLWGYAEATGRYFSEKETGKYYAFRVVYTLPALDGYYAFSTDVPDATVQAFQDALDALKTEKDAEGITAYERIVQRYIPPSASGMTTAELAAFVQNASEYAAAAEKPAALAEFQKRDGRFSQGDVYIYAYDYNGTLLAHPYQAEKIGSSLIERRDPFGMENIRALVETARSGGGYVVFVWPNPDNENRDELKIGYVLPVDETWWVGSGVYLSEITGVDSPSLSS